MEQTSLTENEQWPPRRIALATLVVLLIAGGFWVFFSFRLVFFSLFTAIMLSTALEPLIKRLGRWGISRTVSVILVSLLILLVLIALVLTIAPLISEQWATITSIVGSWYRDAHDTLISSSSLIIRRIGRQLPPYMPLTLPAPNPDNVQGKSLDLVQQAVNTGTAVLRALFILIAVGLLTNYWILEGERATRLVLLAFKPGRREAVRDFINQLNEKVGAYTRGVIVLCSIIGVMQLIAYIIIGLPNALLLGILAGIMEAVPLIGPLLGAVPAFVVAAAFDPSKVIWVVVSTIIVQALENNLIVPRVMDRAVGVNPVASLLAFIAFGSIFGLVGALLAIPLAAVIQLILRRTLFNTSPSEPSPLIGRDAVSTLRYEAQNLVQDVRKQVRQKQGELDEQTDQVEDALESVIQDLESILAKAEQKQQEHPQSPGGLRS